MVSLTMSATDTIDELLANNQALADSLPARPHHLDVKPSRRAGDRDVHGLAPGRVRGARPARRAGARAAQRRRSDHRRCDPLAGGLPAAARHTRGDADPPHRLRHADPHATTGSAPSCSRPAASRRRSRSSPSATWTQTCASRSCACAAARSCPTASDCARVRLRRRHPPAARGARAGGMTGARDGLPGVATPPGRGSSRGSPQGPRPRRATDRP